MKPFGLLKPEKKKQPVKPVASLFEEDVEEATHQKELTKPVVVATSSSDQYAEQIRAEALQEHPNVFDYDAALDEEDSLAAARQHLHRNSRLPTAIRQSDAPNKEATKSPQYMANLLARAQERKIESELIKMRMAKRRANADAADNEEVFVTSSYREKLKDLEEKEAQLKALQADEEDGDVTKKQDMSGFYFNLMKRNVSFGGQVKKPREEIIVKKSEADSDEKEVTATATPPSEPEEETEEEEINFGPVRPK